MTWVLPRLSLPKNSLTTEQLLAAYWLERDLQPAGKYTILEQLTSFVKERQFKMTDAAIEQAAEHLQSDFVNEDIEQWVVCISFMGHPHAIWNFMLDAVAFAKTDDHLARIACGLAETILAHYGSLIPLFESQARKSQKFACMLTAARRHRMCDDVWMRLRVLQANVALPLPQMLPADCGIDYLSEYLTYDDRNTPNKGLYSQDTKGNWVKKLG
jgi:hypothetical protein